MKVLLAMINCHRRQAYAESQRETWIPNIPAGFDYRYFLGPSERTPRADEVFLQCNDDYEGLPEKVREAVRWALAHGYDYMFKVDDDVVLRVPSFFSSDFRHYDFIGHKNKDEGAISAPWGFCYGLSKKCMQIIAEAPLPYNNNDEVWVANNLSAQGILLHDETRYILYRGKRADFMEPASKRPLRAPRRPDLYEADNPKEGLAYCVFVHWLGYHATPDELNIREYHKLYKDVTQQ